MNKPIQDGAAILFAASFYRAIGFGRSVREAFDLGKVALLLEGIAEDQTPEMFVRKGVDASALGWSVSRVSPCRMSHPLSEAAKAPRSRFLPWSALTFVKTLANLSPSDFELLAAAIPEAARHVSRQGTIPEKVADLMRWVEGSRGPGIAAVQEAYREIFRKPAG